jgi:hypothetical protein
MEGWNYGKNNIERQLVSENPLFQYSNNPPFHSSLDGVKKWQLKNLDLLLQENDFKPFQSLRKSPTRSQKKAFFVL